MIMAKHSVKDIHLKSPITYYSLNKREDLSTLAMAMAGYRMHRKDDIVPTDVSDALDIFIMLKRNPDLSQNDLARRLGLSQPTVHRRIEVLREMTCTAAEI